MIKLFIPLTVALVSTAGPASAQDRHAFASPGDDLARVEAVDETVDQSDEATEPPADARPPSAQSRRLNHFYVIDLTCPAEKGEGRLDLVKKNRLGELYRAQFWLAKDVLTKLSIETARPGRKREPSFEVDGTKPGGAFEKDLLAKSRLAIDFYSSYICFGLPEVRRSYFAMIAAQKRRLRGAGMGKP